MRVLVIDDIAKAEIARVVAHAESNRMGIHALMRVLKGQDKPVGERDGYKCLIPDGFRCVYNIEEQPMGWTRHLSVSVPGDKLPNHHAVLMLAKEFGFTRPFEEWSRYLEEDVRAVNVLEQIESSDRNTEAPRRLER